MSLSKAGYNSRAPEINGVTIRTDWLPFTLFTLGDVIDISGTLYEALVTHTSSATFAADLSTKWIVHKIRTLTNLNGGQFAGLRNLIINGNFSVNQSAYASGAAVGAGLYGHDMWKMAASGDTYTFSTVNNLTTITIPAGKVLRQIVEGLNLETGTYCLSWQGTAQGKIGAGSLSASGVTGAITGGTNTTIEFGPGTVSNVMLELGSVVTPFEHRHVGLELLLCQRYYQVLPDFVFASTSEPASINKRNLFTPMRATPTMTGTPASGTGATILATGFLGYTQSGVHSALVAVTGVTASARL